MLSQLKLVFYFGFYSPNYIITHQRHKESNKYFVNRLLSYTPKGDSQTTPKLNCIRNSFYQRNAQIFVNEIKGIDSLLSISLKKLPKRNILTLESTTANSIYYVKKIMEILGNLPLNQSIDTKDTYLQYSVQIFEHLLYTLAAALQTQHIQCKTPYIVESEVFICIYLFFSFNYLLSLS